MINLKVAIFSCDNGYGHARRSILVGRYLAKKGFDVTVFVTFDAIHRFTKLFSDLQNVRFKEFQPETKRYLHENRIYENNPFEKFKNSIWDFDYVISDNLPEILIYRSDAFLSGSFLWHQITKEIDNDYRNNLKELFLINKVKIFAPKFFSMPDLSKELEVLECGLVMPDRVISAQKGNLLISGGKTKNINEQLIKLIEILIQNTDAQMLFKTIYLDEDLYNDRYKNLGFEKANFSAEMYSTLSVAIIRPGIGTITECIANRVYILTIDESTNDEITYNTNQIRKLGIGERFDIDTLLKFNYENWVSINHQQFEKINLSGAEDVYNYLLSK